MYLDVVLAMHCIHHVLPLVCCAVFDSNQILIIKCRRENHQVELERLSPRWDKLFEKRNGGYFRDFQPFWGYLGAFSTLLIVFFFNTVSLWNQKRIGVKAVSVFVSPAIVLMIWMIKKLIRRDGRRFRFFVSLSDFAKFERRLRVLEDLIYPGEEFEAGSKYEMVPSPGHTERFRPLQDGTSDVEDQSQGQIRPDHDRGSNKPPSFSRANLTLAPIQNNIRQDFLVSEQQHHPQPPVSPIQSPEPEHELWAAPIQEPVAMPPQQMYHRLSPSMASSRRGLGNIHETEAELEANSMASNDGSREHLTDVHH